jgi:3-hydroxyacyl-CoA dehydrogenase
MGTGIAVAFANAGFAVTLADPDPAALERARTSIRAMLQGAVDRGRIDEAQRDERLRAITFAAALDALAPSPLVIEAVYEDLELKRSIFATLSGLCERTALLATNTSTLDIDAVGERVIGPERLLGLHFFSPAHIMKLVEIVRGKRTSAETIERARIMVERIGKIGIVVGSCDGFVGNRMLLRYRREAELLLEEGALPHHVDAALTAFGVAMGPFAVSDLAGLDIAHRAKLERAKRGGVPFRQSRIPERLVESGRLGQKTGAGYYRYAPGDRTPQRDPAVEAIIADERALRGIVPRAISNEEIVERTLLALYREGERILIDGIAASAGDIDAVWRHGYGFPASRGGPMAYARSLDQAELARTLDALTQRDPAFWGLPAARLHAG